MAQQLTEKGLGLADMMVSQLSSPQTAPDEQAEQAPMKLDGTILQTYQVEKLNHIVREAMPEFTSGTHESILPHGSNNGFMARLSIPALVASQQSGIPHQLIMAQAALESGWGQREIPTAEGKTSYNLFGIKAGSNWTGPVSEVMTTEYEQGIARKVKARFRVYGSYVEAVSDYVKLLTGNPRYAAVTATRSPEQAAHALQQAGYATDPQYAQKLISLIKQIKNLGTTAIKAYTHDLRDLF
jgi:flagellar protein FlgJ